MRSLNRVFLIGNLGRDPESKNTASGVMVAQFSIACEERFKQNDQWQSRTEWVSVTVFGRNAEIARDYLRKGCSVHVEGRIKTDSWDDKKTGEKRYKTHVIAESLILISPKPQEAAQTATRENEIGNDDIPF